MKIIITEQQFNLILLGEGRGDKQYTPEELKTSEKKYENLLPNLLIKYNKYVKQFEDYYTNTGKLMPVKNENGGTAAWYYFINNTNLAPKFYKDVKRDEKIEEIKKQTYKDIVKYYNDLYNKSGIILTQEYNPDYGWLGKENSKPLKSNPDYVWLYTNKKLGDFYKETFYRERKELLKEPLKDEKYDRLVKKYNKLWDEKREIISSEIPNTNPRKANPDFDWLRKNKKWEEFKIATNYDQRVKEMGGKFRNYLIGKYGFIPEKATAQQVLDYIEKKGIETWDDFIRKEGFLYGNIPTEVRDEVRKKYDEIYVRYGFYPQKATPEEIANYVLKNYISWVDFIYNGAALYHAIHSRKILDDVLKLLPGDFKTGKSIGEKIIKTILSELNIEDHIYDKSVFDCVGEKGCTLRPDFQLPNYGGTENNKGVEVWIEYDGIQHFIPKKRFGCIEGLKTLIKNDIAKNQYCSGKTIKMIRISYKTKKYEEIKDEIIRGLASNEKIYLSKDYPKLGWNDPRLKDDPEMNYLYEYECN